LVWDGRRDGGRPDRRGNGFVTLFDGEQSLQLVLVQPTILAFVYPGDDAIERVSFLGGNEGLDLAVRVVAGEETRDFVGFVPGDAEFPRDEFAKTLDGVLIEFACPLLALIEPRVRVLVRTGGHELRLEHAV